MWSFQSLLPPSLHLNRIDALIKTGFSISCLIVTVQSHEWNSLMRFLILGCQSSKFWFCTKLRYYTLLLTLPYHKITVKKHTIICNRSSINRWTYLVCIQKTDHIKFSSWNSSNNKIYKNYHNDKFTEHIWVDSLHSPKMQYQVTS